MTRGDRKAQGSRSPEPPQELDPGTSTLESFVARLHDEGVQAGREEAERLVREARAEAERIVEAARNDAGRLREEAEARAEKELERGRAELELAARDAVFRLSEVLASALRTILSRAVERELDDPTFLKTLLTDAVSAYARADAGGAGTVAVRLPAGLGEELERWAMRELARGIEDGGGLTVSADLRQAGFEYRVDGGTVEVTEESAVELFMELLTPRLRSILGEAMDAVPQ